MESELSALIRYKSALISGQSARGYNSAAEKPNRILARKKQLKELPIILSIKEI